ncbi:c-type cytochrome biogenesis protein CcmI [Paraglaciecola sp. 2405UD69-4]|uniref:c-type cytochrome biogenesis protein CcmI n=1 Tax=Paraglaciecola sp. 2405UD69-4 TaxID=3391836 RepID=UPI0039C951D6
MFYLWVVGFVLVALLLCCLPWIRKQKLTENVINNKVLIKQRLNELDTEQEQGLLDSEDTEQSKEELTLAMLDEVGQQSKGSSNVTLIILFGALLSGAIGLAVYWQANQISQIEHWQEVRQKTSELGQRMIQGDASLQLEDLQDFSLGLRTKLIDNPDDPVGWMLLGRVYGAMNSLNNAIQAFEKSLQLDSTNTNTMASYAQALLMTGQENQVLRSKQVLLHLLTIEPDNTNAMGVLAVVATQLNDKQLALDNWQGLLAYIPNTEPNYQLIEQRIEELKRELSVQSDGESKFLIPSVSVTVELASDITLPKEGFLVVFAQENNSAMKMPAAVVKMPLGEFPVVVELSNENAMLPTYTLSDLKDVKIVARISTNGDVTQTSGDLQGERIIALSKEQQTNETITIDRTL